MNKTFLILTLSLTICYNGYTQKTIEEKTTVMLGIIGINDHYYKIIDKTIDTEKNKYNNILDEKYFEKIEIECKTTLFQELIGDLIPIYNKHLTEIDLDKISTLKKDKVVQLFPKQMQSISEESTTIREAWIQKIKTKILNKVESSNEVRFYKENSLGCFEFRNGDFLSILPDSTIVKINRKENKQIEKVGDKIYEFQIKWLTECRYKMIGLKQIDDTLPNDTLEVNIYNVKGNIYNFISKFKGNSFLMDGELSKVK